MNNTDQNGYSGRTMTPAGHYHNGRWYSDSKCQCELSDLHPGKWTDICMLPKVES